MHIVRDRKSCISRVGVSNLVERVSKMKGRKARLVLIRRVVIGDQQTNLACIHGRFDGTDSILNMGKKPKILFRPN